MQQLYTLQLQHYYYQFCLRQLPNMQAVQQQSSSNITQVHFVQHKASLSCLKTMYMDEKSSLIKRATKLTHKSLYPSNLERQQVALVVNIFNDFNAAALEMRNKERDNETALFIRLVTAWWRVVNVKHPNKGLRLRDSLSEPISQITDYRLEFFELLCQ